MNGLVSPGGAGTVQGVRLRVWPLRFCACVLVGVAACGGRQVEAPTRVEVNAIPDGVPCAVDARWERPPETIGERPSPDDQRSRYCVLESEGSSEGSGLELRMAPVDAR